MDYEADIRISQGDTVMEGTLSYKQPNLLRIDFTEPEGQVIVSDGTLLTVYYPELEVIFEQTLRRRSDDTAAGLATRQGLHFLQSNYAIAYLVGPDPVSLDGLSGELVVKLNLTSRSTSEGFRQLEIAVAAGNLIRRITGITVGFEEHRFDFFNVRTNQNIPIPASSTTHRRSRTSTKTSCSSRKSSDGSGQPRARRRVAARIGSESVERPPTRGGAARRVAATDSGRGRVRQDAGDRDQGRPPDRDRCGGPAAHPGGDLHQQGGRGDALPGPHPGGGQRSRRRRRAGDDPHLPRLRLVAAAGPRRAPGVRAGAPLDL